MTELWFEQEPEIWRKTLKPKNPRHRRGWIDNVEDFNDMVWIDPDEEDK